MRSSTLGLFFLAPALIFVTLFYLMPVVLTAVFGFTNMSTATGITGGAWHVTPAALRDLARSHPDLAAALREPAYVVDEAGLAKLAEGDPPQAYLAELRTELAGHTFDSRREIESALRRLDSSPRDIRLLKRSAAAFERSVVNARFDSRAALMDAVADRGIRLEASAADALARHTYTGWVFTTENFRRMVQLPDTREALVNTVFYVFTTLTLFNTGFALVLAIGTHYLPDRAGDGIRAIWLLPRVLPPVLYVLMWKWVAWDGGFLSAIAAQVGLSPRNWMMASSAHAWTFVILINGVVGASMGMLIFTSAIRAIPRHLFYASEVDGASRLQQVRHVILPQLRWPILFITTYQTLSLLSSFEYILLSTGGGPGDVTEVWSLKAYSTALSNYAGNLQYGYGAALALVLVVIGIALSVAYLVFFDFRRLVRPPRIEQ